MTNDARLFPPRPQWEARDYRPDEYSRWLLGNWRPIEELWAELRIDPARPQPAVVELEDWLFDSGASPKRRQAERRFAYGHLLAPGDVQGTPSRARCARPPYDRLPLPRVAIPEGIILSREADAWIDEADIKDVALPLYEGRMIGQFDSSQKGWVSGKGRTAVWRDISWKDKQIEPQFLMAETNYRLGVPALESPKLAHMNIASGTNERTAIGAYVQRMPVGHSAGVFFSRTPADVAALTAVWNSISFDFVTRLRVVGLHLDYHLMEQNPVPLRSPQLKTLIPVGTSLTLTSPKDAPSLLLFADAPPSHEASPTLANWGIGKRRSRVSLVPALRPSQRVRGRAIVDAIVATLYGLDLVDFQGLMADCDHPLSTVASKRRAELRGKAFWRVDKDKPPELRQTVLAQVAFADLRRHIDSADGDPEAGLQSFMAQNHGEGWHLPETLRLADHGLGHDDRARQHQPVATELGPRFYDWQLAQPPEEARCETHLHARNILGDHAYRRLLRDLDQTTARPLADSAAPLSEVAEQRRSWHNRLAHTDKDSPQPTTKPTPDQRDIFD